MDPMGIDPYALRRCLGTQNLLQNHLQKGAVSIRGCHMMFQN